MTVENTYVYGDWVEKASSRHYESVGEDNWFVLVPLRGCELVVSMVGVGSDVAVVVFRWEI